MNPVCNGDTNFSLFLLIPLIFRFITYYRYRTVTVFNFSTCTFCLLHLSVPSVSSCVCLCKGLNFKLPELHIYRNGEKLSFIALSLHVTVCVLLGSNLCGLGITTQVVNFRG
jgi:hypothetical protein